MRKILDIFPLSDGKKILFFFLFILLLSGNLEANTRGPIPFCNKLFNQNFPPTEDPHRSKEPGTFYPPDKNRSRTINPSTNAKKEYADILETPANKNKIDWVTYNFNNFFVNRSELQPSPGAKNMLLERLRQIGHEILRTKSDFIALQEVGSFETLHFIHRVLEAILRKDLGEHYPREGVFDAILISERGIEKVNEVNNPQDQSSVTVSPDAQKGQAQNRNEYSESKNQPGEHYTAILYKKNLGLSIKVEPVVVKEQKPLPFLSQNFPQTGSNTRMTGERITRPAIGEKFLDGLSKILHKLKSPVHDLFHHRLAKVTLTNTENSTALPGGPFVIFTYHGKANNSSPRRIWEKLNFLSKNMIENTIKSLKERSFVTQNTPVLCFVKSFGNEFKFEEASGAIAKHQLVEVEGLGPIIFIGEPETATHLIDYNSKYTQKLQQYWLSNFVREAENGQNIFSSMKSSENSNNKIPVFIIGDHNLDSSSVKDIYGDFLFVPHYTPLLDSPVKVWSYRGNSGSNFDYIISNSEGQKLLSNMSISIPTNRSGQESKLSDHRPVSGSIYFTEETKYRYESNSGKERKNSGF